VGTAQISIHRRSWRLRLSTLLVLGSTIVSILGCAGAEKDGGPEDSPDVLLIIVDDLRPDLGAYGHPLVSSPNIDRLAARGLLFERAYAQYPLCNPSRTSLLTGLRPDRTGVFSNQVSFLTTIPNAVTLPLAFRQQGYFTAGVGKVFHGSDRHGRARRWVDPETWDSMFAPGGANTRDPSRGAGPSSGQVGKFLWRSLETDEKELVDGRVASSAIEILEQPRQKPLFLAVGFAKPHLPFEAPSNYFDLYPLEKVDRHDQRIDTGELYNDTGPITRQQRLELTRAYWACISYVDSQIGRIFDTLDRLDSWQNTIVVLVSDHGFHLGENGAWLKTTLFEVANRVPFLLWAPSMEIEGARSNDVVELVDLYPTLLELAGLEAQPDLDGQSLAPLTLGISPDSKQAAFSQLRLGRFTGRSVRTDRWRYTEWNRGRRGTELFDQMQDPWEIENLANRNDLGPIRRRLRRTLRGIEPPRSAP
jgi:uncharacterized sulfatase